MRTLAVAVLLIPLAAWADAGVSAVLPASPDAGAAVDAGAPDPPVLPAAAADAGVPSLAEPAPVAPAPRVMAPTAAELLAEDRAVFLQQQDAAGAVLSVRGFSGTALPVREGALRWMTAGADDRTALTALDPFWVEGVELVRGMSPVRMGSDALGGAVLVRSRSVDFARPGELATAAAATLVSGSEAFGGRGHVRASIAGANSAALVGLTGYSLGDLTGGARTGIQPYSSLEGYAAHAVLRQRLSESAAVEARYDLIHEGHPLTAESSPRDVFRLRGAVRHALALNADFLEAGPFDLRVELGAQRRQAVRDHTDLRADLLSRDLYGEWAFGARLELHAAPLAGTLGLLDVRFGFDGRHDVLDAAQLLRAPLSSGARAQPVDALRRYAGPSSDSRGALFVSAATDPARAWRVTAGLRAELFHQFLARDDRLALLDPSRASLEPGRRTGQVVSGELGLHLAPLPGWNVAARGAVMQRPPTLAEQLRLGEVPYGFVLPTRALREAQAYFGELSTDLTLGRLRVEAAYAYSYVGRPVTWASAVLDSEVLADDGRRILQRAESVRARINAFDGAVALRLPGDLSLRGTFALVYGSELRVDSPEGATEAPLPRLAPPFGGARLRWSPPEGHYLELAFEWALPQKALSPVDLWDPAICTGPLACTGTDGFAALHLRGGYRFNRHVGLAAEVNNLSNATYRYHGSALDRPGLSARLALEGTL